MSNLSGYVTPGGVMLPSRVSVMASLCSLSEFSSTDTYVRNSDEDDRYVSMNWETAVEYVPGTELDRIDISLSTRGLAPGYCFASVASEVEIGSLRLGLYQSRITVPQFSRKADGQPQFFYLEGAPVNIRISYAPGERLNEKASVCP
jgi:hypothetical protein